MLSAEEASSQTKLDLAVSAEPLSPPTVENLTASGVCFPTLLNTAALQYLVMS